MLVIWTCWGIRGGAGRWSNVSSSTFSRPPDSADALSNSACTQDAAPPMPSPLGSGSESVCRVLKLARTKIDRWIRSAEMSETILLMSGSVTGVGDGVGASAPRTAASATAANRNGAPARMGVE